MNDNNDIPLNRVQAALDSVTTINKLIELQNGPKGNLDPIEISRIVDFNLRHLQIEKDKGGFTGEQVSAIQNAITNAVTYIENNPVDGGGGGPKPSSIVMFQDCMKGFIFALDFTPEIPLIKEGQVFNISSNGYKGCGQVIPMQDKQPIPYTRPSLNNEYKTCEECNKTL